MTEPPRILIAGIGNIFLGDDAFGSEVARHLAGRNWPDGVRVIDFGIRSFDLTYALLDGYDAAIFIDTVQRGGEPGTLYLIEPDAQQPDELEAQGGLIEAHGMNPLKVLNLVKAMGGACPHLLVVGCEPLTLGPAEGLMGLSAPVEKAVNEAALMVDSLVVRLIGALQSEQVPASHAG